VDDHSRGIAEVCAVNELGAGTQSAQIHPTFVPGERKRINVSIYCCENTVIMSLHFTHKSQQTSGLTLFSVGINVSRNKNNTVSHCQITENRNAYILLLIIIININSTILFFDLERRCSFSWVNCKFLFLSVCSLLF